MSTSYQSLRVASRIRPRRRSPVSGQPLAVVLALGVLVLQGSPLGDGERAKADPLATSVPVVTAAASPPVAPAEDTPRFVRTIRITSDGDLIVPPRSVVSCEQPPAGTWRLRTLSDSGCGTIPLPDAGESPVASADQPRSDPTADPTADPAAEASRGASAAPAGARSPSDETSALMSDPAPTAGAAPFSGPRVAPVPSRPQPPIKLLGKWQPKGGCSRPGPRGDCITMVIDERGAKAGPASCRFLDKKQDGNRFAIRAECSSGGETWTSNVRLVVAGSRMTWTSERGSQDYTR